MVTLNCYTGIPVQNKVLDGAGNLKADYWTIRFIRDGNLTGHFAMSVQEAVEDAILENQGVIGLTKVEFRGNHIGDYWTDVTSFFKSRYHEGTTDAR